MNNWYNQFSRGKRVCIYNNAVLYLDQIQSADKLDWKASNDYPLNCPFSVFMMEFHYFPAPMGTHFGFPGADRGVSILIHHNTPVYSRTVGRYLVHCWDGVIRYWHYNNPGPPLPLRMKIQEMWHFEELCKRTRERDSRLYGQDRYGLFLYVPTHHSVRHTTMYTTYTYC